MHRRSFGLSATRLAAASASLLAFVLPGLAQADGMRISGPVVHDNLAVYFVRGPSSSGRVPLTLQEAMANGFVKVH